MTCINIQEYIYTFTHTFTQCTINYNTIILTLPNYTENPSIIIFTTFYYLDGYLGGKVSHINNLRSMVSEISEIENRSNDE